MQIACPNESYYTGAIQCNAIEYLAGHKYCFQIFGGQLWGHSIIYMIILEGKPPN